MNQGVSKRAGEFGEFVALSILFFNLDLHRMKKLDFKFGWDLNSPNSPLDSKTACFIGFSNVVDNE